MSVCLSVYLSEYVVTRRETQEKAKRKMSLIQVKNDHQSHNQQLGSFYMNSCPSWFKTQEQLDASLLNPNHELYYVQTDQKHIATSLIIAQRSAKSKMDYLECLYKSWNEEARTCQSGDSLERDSMVATSSQCSSHLSLCRKRKCGRFSCLYKIGFQASSSRDGSFFEAVGGKNSHGSIRHTSRV